MFVLYLLSWSRTASIVCKTVVCDISWSLLFHHRSVMVLLVTRCGVGGRRGCSIYGGDRFLCDLRRGFKRRWGEISDGVTA